LSKDCRTAGKIDLPWRLAGEEELMRRYLLVLLCTILVGNLAVACDERDGADFGDDDNDVDTGTGTESDTGQDTGSSTEDECPINSGYPCICQYSVGICEDSSPCLVDEGHAIGVCSPKCFGSTDTETCQTDLYGVQGIGGACVGVAPLSHSPDQCLIICEILETTGPCPPGTSCVEAGDFWVCIPE
jgi:hypothetical protein